VRFIFRFMSFSSQNFSIGFNTAKEKLEIVSGAAPRLRRGFGGQAPPFRIFAGGIFRKNAFGLIQKYCNMPKEKIFLFLFLALIVFASINFGLGRILIDKGRAELKYPFYIKGIYINSWTAGDQSKMAHLLNLIKETELNAVVIDIKEIDGIIAIDNIIPNLKDLVRQLHQENIYAIARIVVFKDGTLSKIKPELALKNQQGKLWQDWRGQAWLDPTSKEVWDYHIELAKEAIKIGFDEINFDYIRFPSDGDISTIVYPARANQASKPEIMREFFEYLNKELKPLDVFLSIDLFGLTMVREDDMNIGQLLENAIPYFDFVCPMVYPSHYPPDFEGYKNPADYPYEIITMNLSRGKERMNNANSKLRPWLQDFNLGAIYNKKMIELEKQAVYDTSSYGWLLWNPTSRYTEEALEKN